jgi:hypothetical protein
MYLASAILVACLFLGGLALPPALAERSWKRFFVAALLSFFGVLLPLFVFYASGFLVPDAKNDCRHGWLDCFHQGKFALSPLVLWATAALYMLDIRRTSARARPWLVLGLFNGAIISSLCFVFGLTVCDLHDTGVRLWLAVPFYVSVWYSIRAAQTIKCADLSFSTYFLGLASSLPFWIWSLLWSRKIYLALPDTSSSCFVVTAAARGHRRVVGPFVEVMRHGRCQSVNYQLLTLSDFETLWRARAPGSHRLLRHFYNWFGPAVASRITSPWTADAAYLAIKPAEFAARLVLAITSNQEE